MHTPAAAARTTRLSARLRAAAVVTTTTLSLLTVPQLVPSASASNSWIATLKSNMFKVLNAERKAHGVRPVSMNSHLVLSAHRHDLRMARANTMSHRVSGEAFFADRMTAAGYNWCAAAENIGVTTQLTNKGLLGLQRAMYHERAPYNGHRVNILNGQYTSVGIDVYYDRAHRKLWFTQDFGRPA